MLFVRRNLEIRFLSKELSDSKRNGTWFRRRVFRTILALTGKPPCCQRSLHASAGNACNSVATKEATSDMRDRSPSDMKAVRPKLVIEAAYSNRLIRLLWTKRQRTARPINANLPNDNGHSLYALSLTTTDTSFKVGKPL